MSRPEVGAITALWSGPMTPGQWRPRLLRAPVHWRGPTWEEPEHGGDVNVTTLVEWKHTRTHSRGRRDVDIALRWADADPGNPWPLLAAAHEASNISDWAIVEDCCYRGLKLKPDADRQAALCLLWARALRARGKGERAVMMAREAIRALPHVVTRERHTIEGAAAGEPDLNGTMADAWLLLARCASDRQDHLEVLRCASESASYALTQERHQAVRGLMADEAVIVLGPEEAMRRTAGQPGLGLNPWIRAR